MDDLKNDRVRLLIQALTTFLEHCPPDADDYARSVELLAELKIVDKENPDHG